jgi:hypothetical protein
LVVAEDGQQALDYLFASGSFGHKLAKLYQIIMRARNDMNCHNFTNG